MILTSLPLSPAYLMAFPRTAPEHWREGVLMHEYEVGALLARANEVGQFPLHLLAQQPFTIQHIVRHGFNSALFREGGARRIRSASKDHHGHRTGRSFQDMLC
jgi:hypothetical protein